MKNKFFIWYQEQEKKYKGLVSQSTAARLIGISTQHLNRIIDSGRIQKIYFENTPYIGMSEIYEEIERREAKKKSEENGVTYYPFIYPQNEYKIWQKELYEKYKNQWGGATPEEEEEFMNQKLKQWKMDNPEKAIMLAKRLKLQVNNEYDPI